MSQEHSLSPGDSWPHHYRGLAFQASPDGTVWWQLYQGTDRLTLDPVPEEIVEELLAHKRIGGRFHITETGAALTRVEDGDEYEPVYLGHVDNLEGSLQPPDAPQFDIQLRPKHLSPGDLWPSIYDGSRYSFVEDRVWWHNGQTRKRHPVPDGLPGAVQTQLRRLKPEGGSFRILPWGDVITLVSTNPAPGKISEQLNDLPRVVMNIIKLRKESDVDMLPVYVGTIDEPGLDVEEPTSLTDAMTADEKEELAGWAESLGSSSPATQSTQASSGGSEDERESGAENERSTDKADNQPQKDESATRFDDDPLEWMRDDMDKRSPGHDK